MKKITIATLLVLLTMVIAACSGSSNNNGTPQATAGVSGFGTSTAPGTEVSGGVSGTSVVGTSVPSSGGVVTGTSSIPSTGAGMTGTPAAGTAVSGTGVPSTGGQLGEFARLSQFIGFSIMDNNNNSVGTVKDFIINLPKTRVDWIVVDSNGSSVVVPWPTLAFNRTSGNSFTFNGDVNALKNAPAFDESTINWSDQTWDQNFVTFWNNRGANGTSVAGTSVATGTASVPATGATSVSGTAVPAAGSTGSSTNGPVVALLFSQLANVQVVEAASGVPAAGGTAVAGTPMVNSTASNPSVSGTPAAGGGLPATGGLGNIQDAIVNVTSGDVPYFLLVSNGNPSSGTGSSSSSSSSATGTPMATAVATSSSSLPVPGSAAGGTFIPVPSRLLRFVDQRTAVLEFPASMLTSAPTIDFSTTPVLNFGWDQQFLSFWSNGGTGAGTSTGTTTPTP